MDKIEIPKEKTREVANLINLLFSTARNAKEGIKDILKKYLPEDIFAQYEDTHEVLFTRNEAISLGIDAGRGVYTILDIRLFILQAGDTDNSPVYLLYNSIPTKEYEGILVSFLVIGFEVTTPSGFVIHVPEILTLSKTFEMLL